MDIPAEFKIVHWLCTYTAMLNIVELPYIQFAVADPGGWNRCVCNGQMFLIKNANVANLCHSKSARIGQCPQSSSYKFVFQFVIENYSII